MRREEGGFDASCVAFAFLFGGVVGAGLALLLAPQSGVETRRKIQEIASDAGEKTTGYACQAKEKVLSAIDKGKEIFEDKKSAITTAVEAGKEAYEKEVHK